MRLSVAAPSGETIDFECDDTVASVWVAEGILGDRTYPSLPFVDDVEVIVDAGANCGAASVHFARQYPGAQIHSVEPGTTALGFLERNARHYPNIRVHPIGLSDADDRVPLYAGDGDLGKASIHRSAFNLEESELIEVRNAEAWVAEQDFDHIDILKLDVEGCEIPVLESLAHRLPQLKVLYVEYGSRQARRDIARLLDPTHELFVGNMLLDQGEVVYLRKDLAETEAATERLRELLAVQLRERQASVGQPSSP